MDEAVCHMTATRSWTQSKVWRERAVRAIGSGESTGVSSEKQPKRSQQQELGDIRIASQ